MTSSEAAEVDPADPGGRRVGRLTRRGQGHKDGDSRDGYDRYQCYGQRDPRDASTGAAFQAYLSPAPPSPGALPSSFIEVINSASVLVAISRSRVSCRPLCLAVCSSASLPRADSSLCWASTKAVSRSAGDERALRNRSTSSSSLLCLLSSSATLVSACSVEGPAFRRREKNWRDCLASRARRASFSRALDPLRRPRVRL